MKAFLALIRREYLEHRGAFLYAPAILVGVLVVVIVLALSTGNIHVWLNLGLESSGKLFELSLFAAATLWWVYLLLALFFYFADAFNADTRHNAMFFWKSMPQSDFKILASKLAAGLSIFPLLILVALLATGLVLAIGAFAAPLAAPALSAPDLAALIRTFGAFAVVAVCYLVLALLWYAPFFAWVGGLSTVFGRWSIPIAILVPLIASLLDGVINFGSAPGGSYILSFLRSRADFDFDSPAIRAAIFSNAPLNVPALVGALVAGVDWPSLAGGLVFAGLAIYAASEYRRRVVAG